MGMDSKISWTNHTFNGAWGCQKVSPACDHCYAESSAIRWGYDIWGPTKDRRLFGDKHWNEPLKWNEAARKAGVKARVFAFSMADVFENRRDLDEMRERFFRLVEDTIYLDWLILTKRHNEMNTLTPTSWLVNGWPSNAWAGVTAENQEWFDKRMPKLAEVPAGIRWLSVEPMLGPIKLGPWAKFVNWVIVGGESGNEPRGMQLEWHADLLEECRANGIAYHFKQTGNLLARKLELKDKAGKKSDEWPDICRVQEFPTVKIA